MSAPELPPHAEVWDVGECDACGVGRWHIVAIPQISTGLRFPQFGVCTSCELRADLTESPPFQADSPPGPVG